MQLPFFKYHGTGNDFVLVDGRNGEGDLELAQIVTLCDRHFGVGSDGLIIIKNHADEDFEMVFYNPDGSQSFCGNGSRCAVAFARHLGMISNHGSFKAIDGVHFFMMHDSGLMEKPEIHIRMRNVDAVETCGEDLLLNTGSPHYIVKCEDLKQLDIVPAARAIRYNERFSQAGVNVNFVRYGNGELWMRTYERGVEAETLSCGTGVTAAAISLAQSDHSLAEIRVHTEGGELKVKLSQIDGGFDDIWLCGPAEKVFEGVIQL
jgi:diaminopimelate epimerase